MELPLGVPDPKETEAPKKEEIDETQLQYERKLTEYRDTLENYRKFILEYSGKSDHDRRTTDSQHTVVQTALDLSYLKEQQNKLIGLLEDMKNGPVSLTASNLEGVVKAVLDISYKLEGVDKNVVNRLSELILELQKQTLYQNKQMQSELLNDMEEVNRNVKRNNSLLWFIVIFNILGLSGIAFMVLYIMEIIPF
jgi:hypothetical protein